MVEVGKAGDELAGQHGVHYPYHLFSAIQLLELDGGGWVLTFQGEYFLAMMLPAVLHVRA